jgi:hypothetical protein
MYDTAKGKAAVNSKQHYRLDYSCGSSLNWWKRKDKIYSHIKKYAMAFTFASRK